jgi:hypothetical protein
MFNPFVQHEATKEWYLRCGSEESPLEDVRALLEQHGIE